MMDLERWRQIDALLQAALERAPAERDSFLEEACSGDESLKREVESLLSSGEQALSLIDTPAFEMAAGLLSEHIPELIEGELIGHYGILSFLGAGGMGEVYLAEDTKLDRRVAIKLLPADSTFDGKHLHRFRQEARAASALNHPNIITIYEIGQFEGQHFIASEFIEGETLRQHLRRGRIDVGKVLDISIQIASALSVAHGAGIVHRDIKPENIMLRSDGYVKVLDFGLAKSSKRQELGEQSITTPGLLLGTVKYMSPEQARGLAVDSRSDIFSLGVVMYEMVAGRAPFEGATSSDLIAALLKDEPIPLKHYSPSVPDELERIIARSLCKDREARYQDLQSMLDNLKRLKQELELGYQGPERNGAGGADIFIQSDAQTVAQTADGLAISTGDAEAVPTRLAREHITGQLRRRKLKSAAILFALLVAVSGIIYVIDKRTSNRRAPFREMIITKIGGTQTSGYAVISPDGKHLVHVVGGAFGSKSLQRTKTHRLFLLLKLLMPG